MFKYPTRISDPALYLNGCGVREERVRGMSIAGASEASDEKRNRLGRVWLPFVECKQEATIVQSSQAAELVP